MGAAIVDIAKGQITERVICDEDYTTVYARWRDALKRNRSALDVRSKDGTPHAINRHYVIEIWQGKDARETGR